MAKKSKRVLSQKQMQRAADRRMLDVCRTFNEIQTGPNPLTQAEIEKLIAKRPKEAVMAHRKTLESVRAEHEESAVKHLRAAQHYMNDAKSRSNCTDPPIMLVNAADRIGAAMEAWRGVGAEWSPGKKGRSRKLSDSIVQVSAQIRKAMHGYAHGPCVRRSPY